MRLVPVILGSIFLAAAIVVYFNPALVSSFIPTVPSDTGTSIQYSSVLAFGLGISGLTMLARGLAAPSSASMARARQAEASPSGYGASASGGPPTAGGVVPGTIYCQACGRANSTTAAFCQGCGRAMPLAATGH